MPFNVGCRLVRAGLVQPGTGTQGATDRELRSKDVLRYGVARHSIELMKLLDDTPSVRCHVIFLGQGAMGRRQTDKWVRLALIREALRRHGRGHASRLIKVKEVIHRFMADLLHAIGEQSASKWREDLWQDLLKSDPMTWKETYNANVRDEHHQLTDDPVPKAVVATLNKGRIDLKPLATALEAMPLRSMSEESDRQRIETARHALKKVEEEVWKDLLTQAEWRSPLLVMDEAHPLKNPATSLARQLQSHDSDEDLRTGDGAMASSFDRMLFLTATPFQLGHQELVRVLERFGDVKWDQTTLGDIEAFEQELQALNDSLTESQRTAILLQRCWTRLRPEEMAGDGDPDQWWKSLREKPTEQLTPRQRALLGEYGDDVDDMTGSDDATTTLANVQVATGQTKRDRRSRLMRAFNTPFFPDIFVCSEVMGEGVDLQRYCRYVIHHDLAWNPSQIEQRTGRIDRLGCKAENKHPIHLYLPYLAGASDERQYRVMTDREQWFRIVMGQDEVAKLIPDEPDHERPHLPAAFSDGLSFNLGIGQ